MHGRVHACVLMVDDVHLRVASPAAGVASCTMQAVARRSVRYNRQTACCDPIRQLTRILRHRMRQTVRVCELLERAITIASSMWTDWG